MSMMIDAIRDGMAKNAGNNALSQLGELLTSWAMQHTAEAGQEVGTKTLEGAMGAVRDEAKKQQTGGYACISDAVALKIALVYFGQSADGITVAGAVYAAGDAADADPEDALDLDALLGM